MSLSTQTKKIILIVDLPNKDTSVAKVYENKIIDFLKQRSSEYYVIYHDKDINDEGVLKTPHFHILFMNKEKQRLSTILKDFCEFMSIKKQFLVQINVWKDYEGNIQYLVHKNNPEKYQYDIKSVLTDNADNLAIAMERELEANITIQFIIDVVDNCSLLSEVYNRLGLSTSYKYRGLISDIYKDRKGVMVRKLSAW